MGRIKNPRRILTTTRTQKRFVKLLREEEQKSKPPEKRSESLRLRALVAVKSSVLELFLHVPGR